MKKIIISLTLLLLVTVGCGNNEDNVNEEVMEISEEETSKDTSTEAGTSQEDVSQEVGEETATEATSSEDVNTQETSANEDQAELQDYIDIALTDIDGNTVHLSDYEGKFIVLNFFGVWCHYCMEEMPSLEKVYSEYEGDDFVILLVNATTTENIGKEGVIDWYKAGLDIEVEGSDETVNVPITMPMAMDLDGSALQVYPVSGFPTSYFISKEGKILGAVPGMLEEETLLSILDQYKN